MFSILRMNEKKKAKRNENFETGLIQIQYWSIEGGIHKAALPFISSKILKCSMDVETTT